MKKHSVFAQAFWTMVPLLVGVFFAAGIMEVGAFMKKTGADKDGSFISVKTEDVTVPQVQEGGEQEEGKFERLIRDSSKKNSLSKKIEESLPKRPELKVSALSYAASDLSTGKIILEKNIDTVYPIASVTKLLTAYTALQSFSPDKVVAVSSDAVATEGTTGELKAGERLSVKTLLHPLLLESSNDAAEALARSENRTEFLKAMNEAATSMGARKTNFSDASGLSPRNVSTSRDLLQIAKFLYENNNDIFEITRLPSYKSGIHTWINPTEFRKSKNYLGGKNGFTDEAQRTAVSLFSVPQVNGPDRIIAVSVLKSKDRNKDVAQIINYISEYMQSAELASGN